MTCDIRESENQTVERYLGGLNECIKSVVELQHYTTLDKVCSLAHKVELQNKAKLKRELLKPPSMNLPFQQGEPPSYS